MKLGNSLFHARKKCGLSQEEVAEKLGISRQTVSKWETDETVPDIRQSKKMAVLYNMSLDEMIDFDIDIKEIQETIDKTSEETEEKIDWTNAWGKKYPILLKYQNIVNIPNYARRLNEMLDEIEQEYQFNEQDAMLVLKDILYNVWKNRKNKSNR
ncbi:helix-turn-helix transcriptional regulator [Clostridium perfringens]|nr:helix-turn-helix transcriptional regulator [Clostridium perfringens]